MTIPAVCEDSGDFFLKYPNPLFPPIYRRIILIHERKFIEHYSPRRL